MPILQGGGAGSHPLPNHVIGKRMVNTTLAIGHQCRLGALLKINNIHMACSTPNAPNNIIILTGEGDYSQD
jgi:hypothetical protein